MVLQKKSSVILLLLFCILTISCNKRKATLPTVAVDAEVLPMVHAENVTSLISDSGITRYRVEAKVFDMYSNIKEPYWFFPEGVYVEKFDSVFNVEGSITADTAYYYERKELWQLIGNVHVKNLQGDKFETSELFWNQKEPPSSINSIYTDKFVRIDMGDRIITSIGLRSNQSMTDYRFSDFALEATVVESADSIQKKP